MHVRVPLRSVLISMYVCMYVRTYEHMCLKKDWLHGDSFNICEKISMWRNNLLNTIKYN